MHKCKICKLLVSDHTDKQLDRCFKTIHVVDGYDIPLTKGVK
jgi:hypothetical protein